MKEKTNLKTIIIGGKPYILPIDENKSSLGAVIVLIILIVLIIFFK